MTPIKKLDETHRQTFLESTKEATIDGDDRAAPDEGGDVAHRPFTQIVVLDRHNEMRLLRRTVGFELSVDERGVNAPNRVKLMHQFACLSRIEMSAYFPID